jgi:ficolin
MDGSVTFERDWDAYATGFGKLDGEFWLGRCACKLYNIFYRQWCCNVNNSHFLLLAKAKSFVILGNNNIHLLTSLARQQLRVDMRDLEGETRYAKYSTFIVRPAKFNLTVEDYVGTAGNNYFGTQFYHSPLSSLCIP